MTEPGAEFVTVAEAARRLGIGERRAYRLSDKLSDDDKHLSDGRQKYVRLSALIALCETSNGVRHVSDELRQSVRQSSDELAGDEQQEADARAELIAQLRGENERLNAALERSQALLSQALGALANEQNRTAQLEHLQTKLIEALPAPQAPPETPPDAPESGATDESGECAQLAGNGPQEGEPRRAWWRWWRR